MKKIITIALSLVCIFALVGCGSKSNDSMSNQSTGNVSNIIEEYSEEELVQNAENNEEKTEEKVEQSSNEYDGYTLVSDLDEVDYASIEILVRYDGFLYGKSYAIIDYAGGTEKIGVIDKVINDEYVPNLNNETNKEEIKNAEVYDKTDESIILLYNNEYVLFEKINEQ